MPTLPNLVIFPALIAAQLAVLYVLASRTNGLLHRKLGTRAYLLAALPGVIVHELSHLVACWITRTKVRKVRLFEPSVEGKTLVLGYVEHDRTMNPAAAMLVGAAPFFGGVAVLWATALLIAPDALEALRGALEAAGGDVTAGLQAYGGFLSAFVSALRWDLWTTYLLVYALLSVSSHLAPSAPDLRHAAGGAFVLALLAAAAWYAGRRFGFETPADIAEFAARAAATVSTFLTFGVAVTAALAAAVHGAVALLALGRPRRR